MICDRTDPVPTQRSLPAVPAGDHGGVDGGVDGGPATAGGIADPDEAEQFLEQYRQHTRQPAEDWSRRLREVRAEIDRTGTYRHTLDELTVGAKLAWYNHTRCIGKLFWRSLRLRDCRDLETADEVADALVEHLRVAGDGGTIRAVVSVFRPAGPGDPGARIHNTHLFRYAGHRMPDGTVLGDPDSLAVTDLARSLGWAPPDPGRFDVLPLVVEMPGKPPVLREVPPELLLEVEITHPELPAIGELGLRWYGFPTVSDMQLRVGGITYPAVPFTGWYVVTEIAARNFADRHRYDLLGQVAGALGLDTSSDRTLWKDRALVELTTAVLSSYERAGIRMVDHHTAAEQFHRFTEVEHRADRTVNAEWSWIVPPMSASTTPVYHQSYPATVELPNFLRADQAPA